MTSVPRCQWRLESIQSSHSPQKKRLKKEKQQKWERMTWRLERFLIACEITHHTPASNRRSTFTPRFLAPGLFYISFPNPSWSFHFLLSPDSHFSHSLLEETWGVSGRGSSSRRSEKDDAGEEATRPNEKNDEHVGDHL